MYRDLCFLVSVPGSLFHSHCTVAGGVGESWNLDVEVIASAILPAQRFRNVLSCFSYNTTQKKSAEPEFAKDTCAKSKSHYKPYTAAVKENQVLKPTYFTFSFLLYFKLNEYGNEWRQKQQISNGGWRAKSGIEWVGFVTTGCTC